MSARESRAISRTYTRNSWRRKMARGLDLNVVPPTEHRDEEGASAHGASQDTQTGQQGSFVQLAAIDLEELDDDVIICSPSEFAEAKNNARNHRRSVLVDGDSELPSGPTHCPSAEEMLLSLAECVLQSEERSSRLALNNHNKRRRVSANQTIINCDYYINLEGSSNSMRENVEYVAPPLQPPPPPKVPTFSCPVCMGPFDEEVSTKCGHIFCKACIKAAIAAQSKCPTCRRKVTMKDVIRVYLPSAS